MATVALLVLYLVAGWALVFWVLAQLAAVPDLTQPGPGHQGPAGHYQQGGSPWTPRP